MASIVLGLLACGGITPSPRGDTSPADSAVGDDSAGRESAVDSVDSAGPDSDPPALPCGAGWASGGAWVEGQALEVGLACSSGRAAGEFAFTMDLVPSGASFDAATARLGWTPGLDQAGLHRMVLTVHDRAQDAPDEVVALELWIADAWDQPENVPIDPATYTQEFGLPVLDLEVPLEPGYDKEYVAATVYHHGAPLAAEVKYRGAASLYYPKHGLTLRFPDEAQIDLDAEGLGDKQHLVLVSTFDDNSYMRNKLAFDTWNDIASYWGAARLTPHSFFTVVYWNRQYLGLYVGVDRPDDELLRQRGFDDSGNLYKSYSHDANFYRTGASGHTKSTLHDGWEKKEGVPGDYLDLESLTAFSADHDDAAFMASAEAWLDVDEFMDWFLFVFHLSAGDSAGKNAYLYNDPSAPTRFRYCPWDFNQSFGQDWMTLRVPSDADDDYQWANGVFAHFQNDPAAAAVLWARYGELLDGPLSEEAFAQRIDAYEEAIGPSAARDWAKWADSYQAYGWAPYRSGDWTTTSGEVSYLRTWLAERDAWAATWAD